MWVAVYDCSYYAAVHVQLHYYVHVSRVAALGHDQQLALLQKAAPEAAPKADVTALEDAGASFTVAAAAAAAAAASAEREGRSELRRKLHHRPLSRLHSPPASASLVQRAGRAC